jgi:hypothetical protein
MGGIYADYRGDRYNKIRERWEPWYTALWNSGLSDDENLVKVRRGSLETFLAQHLPASSIETVVDVGGDRGQYIPIGERKVVIDPSDRQLVPGVERLDALSDLATADLLISAHVLEHLADPRTEISSYVTASWVYVDGVSTLGLAYRSNTGGELLLVVTSSVAWHDGTGIGTLLRCKSPDSAAVRAPQFLQ